MTETRIPSTSEAKRIKIGKIIGLFMIFIWCVALALKTNILLNEYDEIRSLRIEKLKLEIEKLKLEIKINTVIFKK